MKVYVAAKYDWHKAKEIAQAIEALGMEVFLPKSINIDAATEDEKKTVYDICWEQIVYCCDVILFIYPFRMSVSAEVGIAETANRLGFPKKLILLDLSNEPVSKAQQEVMIGPVMEAVFTNAEELLAYLEQLR